MYDIAAVGDLLIDFTPAGVNAAGKNLFEQNPGGAPANVLAMASKLGCRTAFHGKVGNDAFGVFLKRTLDDLGVDTSGLVVDMEIPTTLAFVQLDGKGDRSFTFYRKPGADIMLRTDELKLENVRQTKVMHFCSVSMTDEPSRSATVGAVKEAKKAGAVISFDPNYRDRLWQGEDAAVAVITSVLPLADIVKVSEEELILLTGKDDMLEGARSLKESGSLLVIVTLGPKGAFYLSGDSHGTVPTYDVKTVDTTGAGDAFVGSMLYRIAGMTKELIAALTVAEIEDILAFANAAGSLTTEKTGAIPAMPVESEILRCMETVPMLK